MHEMFLNNNYNSTKHSGFGDGCNTNLNNVNHKPKIMIFDKLLMPLVSSLIVGTASASVQKSMISENPNFIVGLLGILVTISLWALGHLITLSIKMSRVETQIEDIKSELAERRQDNG